MLIGRREQGWTLAAGLRLRPPTVPPPRAGKRARLLPRGRARCSSVLQSLSRVKLDGHSAFVC